MAITNYDQFVAAMASGEYVPYSKASLTLQHIGATASLWMPAGMPGVGAIPTTTATVCTSTTPGSPSFSKHSSAHTMYLAGLDMTGAALHYMMVYDRLAHVGDFPINTTTDMPCNLTIPAGRFATTDGLNVRWFMETYVAMGSSAKNLIVTYKDSMNADATTSVTVAYGTTALTTNIGQMVEILPPSTSVISEIISVASATAGASATGRYGITCGRLLTAKGNGAVINIPASYDFAQVGMPPMAYNACIWLVARPSNATVNLQSGSFLLISG